MEVDILGFILRINVMMLFQVLGIVVAFLLMLLILTIWWRCSSKNCCKSKADIHISPVVSLIRGVIQEDSYVLNPQYATASTVAKDTVLIPYLSKNCISSMKEIGQGFFGKVYKAILQQTDGKYETVAIKVLKDHNNLDAKEDFMREIDIMAYFKHPNILTLIGICPQEGNCLPWMIFEFMAYGDLAEVLRNNHTQFSYYSEHLPILDKEALLVISFQISAGMKYLASQRFVHRDLACRNCLVGSDLTVKIADFGMSRDVYNCDYYKAGGSRLLPVRWMSPESILFGKFTVESDVWSFGVVLWEIYSLGIQPHCGHSNDKVLELIRDGVLLDIPLNCPSVIREVMKGCWNKNPKKRLGFIEIHDRLKNVTKRPELDGSSPRSPSLPAIVDHLSSVPPEELLDADNYLQPDEQIVTAEYVVPYPA